MAAKKVASKKTPKIKAAPTPEANVKAKRARVPKDLAEQYTAKPAKRRKTAARESAKAQRARRDAEERERLRRLMTPSDDVLRRLSMIGAIASSPAIDGEETQKPASGRKRIPRTTTIRRPRRWESRCGKCGTVGTFKAAAGLCARCGAIAVRL
ncbi:MAG: hypothetical protein M3347_02575 [Armatimonadota bacterium]|nr:hypothetical protein [Armatimonadota bacterium]